MTGPVYRSNLPQSGEAGLLTSAVDGAGHSRGQLAGLGGL